MAHFLERGNEKEIFEAIQACVATFNPSIKAVLRKITYSDLEVAVEKLSQLLEEPIEEDTIKELRRNIMNKTVCLIRNVTSVRVTNNEALSGVRQTTARDSSEGYRETTTRRDDEVDRQD